MHARRDVRYTPSAATASFISLPNPLLIAIPVLSHQAKALSPSEQEPGPCLGLGVRSGFPSTSLFPCAAKLSDTTSMLLDWVLPSEAPTPHRAIDQAFGTSSLQRCKASHGTSLANITPASLLRTPCLDARGGHEPSDPHVRNILTIYWFGVR
jgi:hypothetical protein